MLSDLVKGILPPNWRRYTVPRGCTVIQWITDFSQRVKQLQEVSLLVSQGGAKELKVLCLSVCGSSIRLRSSFLTDHVFDIFLFRRSMFGWVDC
jgi:hypothetical protein